MGNDVTDYIEAELEIAPDRNTRGRFLYGMADRSPAEAIAFINAMEPGTKQEEFVTWLGYYLARQNVPMPEQYAELFENPQYEQAYKSIVASNHGVSQPARHARIA